MSEQVTPPPPPSSPATGAQVPPPAGDGATPPPPGDGATPPPAGDDATPPPAGVGPTPPPAFGAPAQEPKKPSVMGGIGKRVIGAVVAFAVIALGGLAWKQLTGAPETAKAGDCMVGQSADKLKTVECGDAKAEWKVSGKVDNKSESEANDANAMCAAYPASEVAYWEGEKGGKGYVLCLEPIKK
ncbi:hypothetical protein [Micromonospora sp. NPDC049679]|uniref:LppU/SCO3897 family protein n=1 Tax=Micromonospora sp. NPDC049679 TaxID=3155920 RepID=UPI0033DD4C86